MPEIIFRSLFIFASDIFTNKRKQDMTRLRFYIAVFLLLSNFLVQARNMDGLRTKLNEYISRQDATIGIAVISRDGDTLTINDSQEYPMMSVFKFHQALGVADRMNEKGIAPDSAIYINKGELARDTWSPLRDRYPEGGISISIREALKYTLQDSDNLVCDILFDRFISPSELEDYIRAQGIPEISIKHTEEDMYFDHPVSYENWTSPYSAALLMDKFIDGKIISGVNYSIIRDLMLECNTGTARLKKAFASSDYQLGHKTGSGYRNADGRLIACNDIGFILSPEGNKEYTIAVFVKDSALSDSETEQIIATISAMVKEELLENSRK